MSNLPFPKQGLPREDVLSSMRAAIMPNMILMIGSAPSHPHGSDVRVNWPAPKSRGFEGIGVRPFRFDDENQ